MEFSYTHPAMQDYEKERASREQESLYFPYRGGWLQILGDDHSIRIGHVYGLYPYIGQRTIDKFSYEYKNGVGKYTNHWDYRSGKFGVTDKQANVLEQEFTEIAIEFERDHYHIIQNRLDANRRYAISEIEKQILELEKQLSQKRFELKTLTSNFN